MDRNLISETLADLIFREVPEKGQLYIVGTPLGNRADITARALGILAQVDLIAAEDTRHSGELLSFYGVKNKFLSFHQHNFAERKTEIVRRLRGGEAIALISDAGMPTISDPGQELVDLCLTEGIPVKIVPGPSAGIAALAISGIVAGDFRFVGFLPVKGKARQEQVSSITSYRGAVILYEAPHRLTRTLADLSKGGAGTRQIAVCRELTKQYEEVKRGSVDRMLAFFTENPPRGEFVLVLGPAEETSADSDGGASEILEQTLRERIQSGASDKDLLSEYQADAGLSRNEMKKLLLRLRGSL